MDLTIIIVSFKSGEILDRCLDPIDDKYPVIIVENSLNTQKEICSDRIGDRLEQFQLERMLELTSVTETKI